MAPRSDTGHLALPGCKHQEDGWLGREPDEASRPPGHGSVSTAVTKITARTSR